MRDLLLLAGAGRREVVARAAAAGGSRLARLETERNGVAAPSIETAATGTPPVRAVRA